MGVPGLEPGTSSLSAKRSNRLSYTPRCLIGPRHDFTAHPGPISNRGIPPVAISAESRAFLVVRQRDADAAHQGGGDVVQHRGQHGQGRQQHHVDHGDDGGEGGHLAQRRNLLAGRSRRPRCRRGSAAGSSTRSKMPVRSRTVHSTMEATTVTMPRATDSRKAIFSTDQGSTLLTSRRAVRTLAFGAGLTRPGALWPGRWPGVAGRWPGATGRCPCGGPLARARWTLPGRSWAAVPEGPTACPGSAADAPGHSLGERMPAAVSRRDHCCSAWEMSRNYSLVTSGVVFVQLGVTARILGCCWQLPTLPLLFLPLRTRLLIRHLQPTLRHPPEIPLPRGRVRCCVPPR